MKTSISQSKISTLVYINAHWAFEIVRDGLGLKLDYLWHSKYVPASGFEQSWEADSFTMDDEGAPASIEYERASEMSLMFSDRAGELRIMLICRLQRQC